jgi:protease-4
METSSFNSPGAPPPLASPPPVITPPPPPKSRKSRGWMIFAIILLVVLMFSLLINFTQFISHALNFNRNFTTGITHEVGPRLEECLLKDNDADDKIAVVRVDGIITSSIADQAGNSLVDVIKAQLNRAKKDKHVRAVILKVDSPGGEVLASDEINRAIKEFQDKSKKPVVCSMGSLAASGGYYISAPCRWIVANQLTLTASIGVIMETVNYRGLMNKVGVEPVVYKSGKFKDMLSGMRTTNEIPAEEHAMVQDLISQTYRQFTNIVVAGRGAAHDINKTDGSALISNWADYADGRVLSGADALKYGFVDQLGDFDDAVKTTEKIARISKANLVEYRERYDFTDFLSMFSQSSKAPDIKLDLGVDIPKLQAGERYFLWLPPAD